MAGLILAAFNFPETQIITNNLYEFLQNWSLVLYCCDNDIKLHIIDIDHLTQCSQVSSNIVFENGHPSVKTIFSGQFFINQYKEWEDNIIVEVYGRRLLNFCCPCCGLEN